MSHLSRIKMIMVSQPEPEPRTSSTYCKGIGTEARTSLSRRCHLIFSAHRSLQQMLTGCLVSCWAERLDDGFVNQLVVRWVDGAMGLSASRSAAAALLAVDSKLQRNQI